MNASQSGVTMRRTRSSGRQRRRRWMNVVMLSLITGAIILTLVPLVAVLFYVALRGIPGLRLTLFTELPRPIDLGAGGMAQSMIGTLVIVLLASVIGVGIGLLAGVYLAEYGRGRIAWSVRFFADVLSGVPSITIGLFVYVLLVVPLGTFSAVAGAVALAMLMLPLVVRTTEEMLRLIPRSLREAGIALGVPYWRVVLRVLLPAAAGGIVTGTLLAIARIAGETAPLLFTAFGNEFFQTALLKPVDAMPLRIYKYAIGPYASWHRIAWAGSLVLIVAILLLSLGARYFAHRGQFTGR